MTKAELLEILQLLSALESWGFSLKEAIPDFIHKRLQVQVKRLQEEVLK